MTYLSAKRIIFTFVKGCYYLQLNPFHMITKFLQSINFPNIVNPFDISGEEISFLDVLDIDVYKSHSYFRNGYKVDYNYRKRNSIEENWVCLALNFDKNDSSNALDCINSVLIYNKELPISIQSFNNSDDRICFFYFHINEYKIDFFKINSALSIQITKLL